VSVRIPPLREQPAGVLLLARYVPKRFNQELNRSLRSLTEVAVAAIDMRPSRAICAS
jgi:DNA-binding NtrC family response regulator